MTEKSKKNIYIVIAVLVVITIVACSIYLSSKKEVKFEDRSVWSATATTSNVSDIAQLTVANSSEYKNQALRFSFRFPPNLKVTNFVNEENQKVILAQDTSKGQGFQVTISEFDEGNIDLTEDRIKQDIPDLVIKESQPVLLGSRGKGIAFLSNNDQFNGNSREVWFVYNGYLYQISTYAHLDPLIKAVLATWKFE